MSESRTALITGGARGIGFGIAREFANAGYRVMIADLGNRSGAWQYELSDGGALRQAERELHSQGFEVRTTELDVTQADSCADAVAATLQEFGRVDALINNAGVVSSGPVDTFAEEDWDRIFAVNTKGVFLMTKAALDALKETRGTIVNTASIAGKRGFANMSAYCGSKFATIGITQSFAQEFAEFGITVNALCPGIVGTAMWLEHLLPTNATDRTERSREFTAAMAQTIPLGRPQTPEDMGRAALYLATAENVSGIALTVAGGFEMN